MSPITTKARRFAAPWLHSDLIGVPFTLALILIIAACVGLWMLVGNATGIFVDKLIFPLALGGLLALVVWLLGRGEPSSGVRASTAEHRMLVIANAGLDHPGLCASVCRRTEGQPSTALVIAPVIASSPLHELTDDIDEEVAVAQARIDRAVAELQAAGIDAHGHVSLGEPMRGLLDGLREFPAGSVVMLEGGEPGWDQAASMAERIRLDVGLDVIEIPA